MSKNNETLKTTTHNYYFIENISPMLNSRIKKIQSFNVFDKAKIYMHYYITQLCLKHNFTMLDMAKEDWQNGWSKPEKTSNQIAFYYLWKDFKIKTIDEFYSEKNIEIRDCGEDWKKRGYAKRWMIQCYGVYDWFWKFESEFNFN